MLTGGLDVIGIYVVAETDHLKTLQGKLRQVSYFMALTLLHKWHFKIQFIYYCLDAVYAWILNDNLACTKPTKILDFSFDFDVFLCRSILDSSCVRWFFLDAIYMNVHNLAYFGMTELSNAMSEIAMWWLAICFFYSSSLAFTRHSTSQKWCQVATMTVSYYRYVHAQESILFLLRYFIIWIKRVSIFSSFWE